jgi:hypothetical protein
MLIFNKVLWSNLTSGSFNDALDIALVKQRRAAENEKF